MSRFGSVEFEVMNVIREARLVNVIGSLLFKQEPLLKIELIFPTHNLACSYALNYESFQTLALIQLAHNCYIFKGCRYAIDRSRVFSAL